MVRISKFKCKVHVSKIGDGNKFDVIYDLWLRQSVLFIAECVFVNRL